MKELGEEDLTVSLNDISSDSFDNDSNHHQFNQNYKYLNKLIIIINLNLKNKSLITKFNNLYNKL